MISGIWLAPRAVVFDAILPTGFGRDVIALGILTALAMFVKKNSQTAQNHLGLSVGLRTAIQKTQPNANTSFHFMATSKKRCSNSNKFMSLWSLLEKIADPFPMDLFRRHPSEN
jgi:hypothetical protein